MKWDVTRRREILLVAAVLLSLVFASAAYFLSWESRTAILSCSDCGNIRVVRVSTKWWRIESVGVTDSHEFVVPPNHVHRWWQYDGRRWNSLQRTGWSRKKYEDGQMEWSGQIDHDHLDSGSQMRVEEWLKVYE